MKSNIRGKKAGRCSAQQCAAIDDTATLLLPDMMHCLTSAQYKDWSCSLSLFQPVPAIKKTQDGAFYNIGAKHQLVCFAIAMLWH
jgi:hypothetical protein